MDFGKISMLEFLKKHLDFRIHNVTWLGILTALAVVPCVMFLPERFGYENGLLENIQMAVLFIGLYLAFTAKTNKKFFIFAGLILTILMIREVNCGRTLFFAVPGYENAFYSWKDIKYGYLAHPIYGFYIALVGIYFLKNKLFINLWEILKNIKLPVWDIVLMLTGMGLGLYAEHGMHNMVFEEITELLFYVSLVGIIYLYSRDKMFKI